MRREFTKAVKRDAFARANGHCQNCGIKLRPGNIEYDHDLEDFRGGDNSLENCVVLCVTCHKAKTKQNAPVVAKTRRQSDMAKGIKKPSRLTNAKFKRKIDGTVIDRSTGEVVR